MSRPKIAVFGAGNVGATVVQAVARMDLGDIVVIDIPQAGDMPKGKALDLEQAAPIVGYDARITGSNDPAAIKGADIIVSTAGFPRKPGMDRKDLIAMNADIARGIGEAIKTHAPNAIVINVANPLDIICYVIQKTAGLPKERILGMAGVLDTARFRAFIAEETGLSRLDIQAMVLGGHGDSMVPLVSTASIGGVPLTTLIKPERLKAIVDRTRTGGGEIVKLLQKGSAYYAPGEAAAQMVEAIIKDRKRVLPCAASLTGEYGFSGIFLGVPCVLGAKGCERIIETPLSPDEAAALKNSADEVQSGIALL
ncbi:MAG: malate dehydrogenase [Planctomycetota bacterium]